MIDVSSAPQSGRVLAYAKSRLVFDAYQLEGGAIVLRNGEALALDNVYELHLFDAKKEFRAQRHEGAWATQIVCAQDEVEDDDHFVFSETQFVKERYWVSGANEKIVVNNHFSFNDEGFLRLDGYRLAMEL